MHLDGHNDANLKWDKRFREEACVLGTEPSRYLADNMEFIKVMVPGMRALDIACGEGRNSIYLAGQGFRVVGLDISEVGLEKAHAWMEREGLLIDFRRANLEEYDFTEQYDLIINFNFLLRDLIPKAVDALSPGGVIVFDTLLDSPYVPTTHKKEHLLRQGELLSIFRQFPGEILLPEERLYDEMPTARLIFLKA
ncbi:MAG: class I SAM-dependent methyltransferase [Deltaproteobacteria bacterium]|nr:class I SAM-dependent methyltransferase [Deltaproteobacteria bacterium]